MRRKLTLQQVEEDTKIRVKYVQAMENEDFDIMPGTTYVKGFLRTYATYLGLDPEVIIDEYRSRGRRERRASRVVRRNVGDRRPPRPQEAEHRALRGSGQPARARGRLRAEPQRRRQSGPSSNAAGPTGDHDQSLGQREAVADALSDCSCGRARRVAHQRRGRRVGGGPQGQRHGRRGLLGNDEERQDAGSSSPTCCGSGWGVRPTCACAWRGVASRRSRSPARSTT